MTTIIGEKIIPAFWNVLVQIFPLAQEADVLLEEEPSFQNQTEWDTRLINILSEIQRITEDNADVLEKAKHIFQLSEKTREIYEQFQEGMERVKDSLLFFAKRRYGASYGDAPFRVCVDSVRDLYANITGFFSTPFKSAFDELSRHPAILPRLLEEVRSRFLSKDGNNDPSDNGHTEAETQPAEASAAVAPSDPEKVNILLRQLFQELAPIVQRISDLAEELDAKKNDNWWAAEWSPLLNRLLRELDAASWHFREWYQDDPLMKAFPKKKHENLDLRSLFSKLDYIGRFLPLAIDKINQCIDRKLNLRDISFAGEIVLPLRELITTGRRLGFLPHEATPQLPIMTEPSLEDQLAPASAAGPVESEAASLDAAQPAAPVETPAAEANLPESVSAEPDPAAPDRPAEAATPPIQPEPSAPTGQEVLQPTLSTSQKPKKWLYGWQNIIDVIGRDILGPELNHEQRVTRLRYLNKQYGGPIRPGKKGQQPFVEEIELLEWWNSLSERYENSEQRLRDVEATVSVQYPFGDRGTVCPDINGGIKKRV